MLFAQIQALPANTAPRVTTAAQERQAADDRVAQDRLDADVAEAKQRALDEKQDAAEEKQFETDRANLISPSPGRSLGGVNGSVSLGSPMGEEEASGTARVAGQGAQYAALATLVAGYDDNVMQLLEGPNSNVVHRYGSPFVGLDALGIYQNLGGRTEQDVRFEVRGQHYMPTQYVPNMSDDGTVNAAYAVRHAASGKTTLFGSVSSTLSTLNSARASDTTVLAVDPYSVQRTYTLSTARAAVERELAHDWRFVQGADITLSTVIHDQPIVNGNGQTISPRGLDYVEPGVDSTVYHDFDVRNVGFARLRYQYIYSRLYLDYATNPPTSTSGYGAHLGTAEVGWTHIFGNNFSAATTVGGQVASALPGATDGSPVYSPLVMETLTYVKPTVFATASASYMYGSVNPRLGLGNTLDGAVTVIATPWAKGRLANLSLLAQGQAARTTLQADINQNQVIDVYAASAEVRYGLNHWLGAMAGYNFLYSSIPDSTAIAPLWRSIYFVGLIGYWSSERVIPPLTTFSAPLQGG